DEFRRLQVWANADYPRDAKKALENGAEGVGLCRTEHMFMEPDRLPLVQAMIMAGTTKDREKQLAKLLPIQRSDFRGIFQTMAGLPVVIRLIDPPLHEFLPNREELISETSSLKATGKKPARLKRLQKLLARVEDLHEANPMLGLRGGRLLMLYPEIARMQVRAIMEAACDLRKRGVDARPEIMIPLVGTLAELREIHEQLRPVVEAVQKEKGVTVAYRLGTMIELPRAALTAGEIAADAEFFSFGTNDLTQTTFGYSRDDAERHFTVRYLERRIAGRRWRLRRRGCLATRRRTCARRRSRWTGRPRRADSAFSPGRSAPPFRPAGRRQDQRPGPPAPSSRPESRPSRSISRTQG